MSTKPKDLLRSAKIKAGQLREITDRKIFFTLLTGARLPLPISQYAFADPEREWTADFAWVPERVMLEVDGSIWTKGAHSSPRGILRDITKHNEAAARGWLVLRCVPGEKWEQKRRRLKKDGDGPATGALEYDVPALTNLAIISWLRPILESRRIGR